MFQLSSATVAVEGVEPGTKPTATITVAMDSDASTAGDTTVSGTCPGLGSSWIQFAPAEKAAALMKDANSA